MLLRTGFAALALATGAMACSSSSTTFGTGPGVDSGVTADASASDANASDTGSMAGDSAAPAEDAGVDAAVAPFVCASPADCADAGSSEVCCEHIHLTGGMIPNCNNDPPVVACTAGSACATSLGTSCSGNTVQRLCKTNADCTESMYNQCCTFGNGSGSESFCANSFVAGFGGGTCQ